MFTNLQIAEGMILNEHAITKANSGKNIEMCPFDMEAFVNLCFDRYQNGPGYPFYADTSLKLTCVDPITKRRRTDDITMLFGSSTFGIKHIIEQRSGEFTNRNIIVRMNEDRIRNNLLKFPQALEKGKQLFDYDPDNILYGDRVILLYDGVFYVVFLQGDYIDFTLLATMFIPTPKYLKRIQNLNG